MSCDTMNCGVLSVLILLILSVGCNAQKRSIFTDIEDDRKQQRLQAISAVKYSPPEKLFVAHRTISVSLGARSVYFNVSVFADLRHDIYGKVDLFYVDGGHELLVAQSDLFWAVAYLNKQNQSQQNEEEQGREAISPRSPLSSPRDFDFEGDSFCGCPEYWRRGKSLGISILFITPRRLFVGLCK